MQFGRCRHELGQRLGNAIMRRAVAPTLTLALFALATRSIAQQIFGSADIAVSNASTPTSLLAWMTPATFTSLAGWTLVAKEDYSLRLCGRRYEAELCSGGAELKAAVADRLHETRWCRGCPSLDLSEDEESKASTTGKRAFPQSFALCPYLTSPGRFKRAKTQYMQENDFAKIGRGQKLLLLQGSQVNRDGLLLLRGFLPELAGSPPKVQHCPRVFGERPSPQP